MTRLDREFVWTGGALFVLSLAIFVWWYSIALARTVPWRGWPPLAFDCMLFTLFASHHSVFARDAVKTRVAAMAGALTRSVYVWIASVLFITVCMFWQPIGGEVYRIDGPAALLLAGVQLAGLWVIARAVSRIDPLELAGIRPEKSSAGLQTTGPYTIVRHPIYLGWILFVFGVRYMTGDRLAFAIISSLYLIAAVQWEERSLRQSFGDEYVRYTRLVRWRILPYVY